MLVVWGIIFCISLLVLVKGADFLIYGSEKIGLAFGLTPFVIGVVILGFGTSLPEIVSSFFAIWSNSSEIVVAGAVGSNIANTLLIIGVSTVLAKKIILKQSLVNIDLSLLIIITSVFIFFALDSKIVIAESICLLLLFVIYFFYILKYKDDDDDIDSLEEKKKLGFIIHAQVEEARAQRVKDAKTRDLFFIILGITFLALGAKFLIDSVIKISEILSISTDVITLTAVAFGTSLPELIVSIKSVLAKKIDLVLGNIVGSNVFNLLLVIGLPGLLGTLIIDNQTLILGLPVLILTSIIFMFSAITRRLYFYEGLMYIVFYLIFIGKLLNLV